MAITAVDSSGNGNDATYGGFPGSGATKFAAGLIPGDLAWIGGVNSAGIVVPTAPADWNNSFSIEFWFKGPTVADHTTRIFLHANQDPAAISSRPFGEIDELTVAIVMDTGGMTVTAHALSPGLFGVGNYQADNCIPYDGLRHHVAFTYDYIAILHGAGVPAGTGTIYVDGVSQTLSDDGSTAANVFTMNPMVAWQIGWDGSQDLGGDGLIVDEYALYDHVLTSGEVSAHIAAAGTFAGYTAAVLGDTPSNYYHLDDRPPGGWHVGNIGTG